MGRSCTCADYLHACLRISRLYTFVQAVLWHGVELCRTHARVFIRNMYGNAVVISVECRDYTYNNNNKSNDNDDDDDKDDNNTSFTNTAHFTSLHFTSLHFILLVCLVTILGARRYKRTVDVKIGNRNEAENAETR